jgi:hypothetical protein
MVSEDARWWVVSCCKVVRRPAVHRQSNTKNKDEQKMLCCDRLCVYYDNQAPQRGIRRAFSGQANLVG